MKFFKIIITTLLIFSFNACSSVDNNKLNMAKTRIYKVEEKSKVINALKQSLIESGHRIEYINSEKGYIKSLKYYKSFAHLRILSTLEYTDFFITEENNKLNIKSNISYKYIQFYQIDGEYNTKKYNALFNDLDNALNKKITSNISHTYTYNLNDKEKLLDAIKSLPKYYDNLILEIYNKEDGFIVLKSKTSKEQRCGIVICDNISFFNFIVFEKNGKLKLNLNILEDIYYDGSPLVGYGTVKVKNTENEKVYNDLISIIEKNMNK
ncbi:hypothetical protein [Oceanivirga salmonicida]|uniref:hypothetical protein n=1 Tax=Oceanivirga salmonicida TaxID=1769291 RepID=UPI00082B4132|nr:hypothetical protein [Oceanivirga salmonicida]